MNNAKKALAAALWLVMIGLALVVTTTYAWLGISRIPFVSDISIYVMTESGLYFAPDEEGQPGEWSTYIDASELCSELAPLKPVTYLDGTFQKIVYDESGRTSSVTPLLEEDYNREKPELDAFDHYETDTGCMIYLDMWMSVNAAKAKIILSEATERTNDGQMGEGTFCVGVPVWNDNVFIHENGGRGGEMAIRVGLEFTPVNQETLEPDGDSSFFIYEPNADVHLDGSTGVETTLNINGNPLIDADHLITQRSSSWTEQDPVYKDHVNYSAGEFIDNKVLYSIESGEVVKVRIYIWMEGQDADLIAKNMAEDNHLRLSFQFGTIAEEEYDTGIGRPETTD